MRSRPSCSRRRRRRARRRPPYAPVVVRRRAGRGPPAERASRRRCRVSANGPTAATCAPSRRRRRPRSARGRARRRGASASTTGPSTQTFTSVILHPRSAARPLATASSRAALSSVSRHSASGSEPQVMPAPVPKRSTPSGDLDPEGADATASSAVPASASTQPTAPQYGPRGAVSRSSMIRSALDLGAPVTEPGGNVAARSSGQPTPARSSPRTVETRWTRPGVLLDGAAGRGPSTRAGPADAAEVVADQVDDHHVLGVVLGQQVRRRSAGALDRAGRRAGRRRGAGRARARRWRSSHARAGGAVAAYGRRVAAGEAVAQAERVACRVGLGARGPGRGWPGRRRRARWARAGSATARDVRRAGPARSASRRGGSRTSGRRRHRRRPYVGEAGQRQRALEVTSDRPEAAGVEAPRGRR